MGRGRKPVDIEKYLAKIKPFLEIDCSLNEACISAGVPYSTVQDYYAKNDEIRHKIDMYKLTPIVEAKKSAWEASKNNPDLALKLLERRRKDEYSPRSEAKIDMSAEITVSNILDSIDGETSDL